MVKPEKECVVCGLYDDGVALAAKMDGGALLRDKLLALSSASAYAYTGGALDSIRDKDEE